MADVILHYTRHGFLNFMNPGVAIFIDTTACCTNNVVVLLAFMGLFKLGNVLSELMFDYQAAIQKQFHGIIKGSPAHPVIVIFHVKVQFLNIEMALLSINLIKDREPLRGFPLAFPLDIF